MVNNSYIYEIIKSISETYANLMVEILKKVNRFLKWDKVMDYSFPQLRQAINELIENSIHSLHVDKTVAKTLMLSLQSNLLEWEKELHKAGYVITPEQMTNVLARSRRQLSIAYRQVIASTKVIEATMLKSVSKIAHEILTEATVAKQMGVSLPDIIKNSAPLLNNFQFIDKKGRVWNPQSYSEMYIRSTINKIQGDTSKRLSNEIDNDLRIIDTQFGSCEVCWEYHDKIISMNVKASPKEIEEITEDGFEYMGTYDNAVSNGFHHVNCRCLINIYVPELTSKSVNNNESKNSKNYQDRQKQRAMERTIRKYKLREAGAFRDSEKNLMHRKVLDWQKTLREFAKQNNLSRMYWRERLQFSVKSNSKWEVNWLLGKTKVINKDWLEEIIKI